MMTEEKFSELYEQYKNMLFKLALKFPSLEENDISSAMHFSIWYAWEKLDKRATYCTLLYWVMKNELIRLLRCQKALKNQLLKTNVFEKIMKKAEFHALLGEDSPEMGIGEKDAPRKLVGRSRFVQNFGV